MTGAHQISTPSGEQAWVIAMEYIEGDDVATFAYDLQKQVRTEGIKNENVQLLGSVVRHFPASYAYILTPESVCSHSIDL